MIFLILHFYKTKKLRGKHLFRSAVRRVLEYINWIKIDISPGEAEIEFEDTVKKKSQEKKELTLQVV